MPQQLRPIAEDARDKLPPTVPPIPFNRPLSLIGIQLEIYSWCGKLTNPPKTLVATERAIVRNKSV